MGVTFEHVCNVLAAVRCLNAGQSFKEIAKAAGKSEATIRRWVYSAGFKKVHGRYRV